MATAFIFNGSNLLMIKKTGSSFIDHPFWSGLGGHLEPAELTEPRQACLREIYEESGLREHELDALTLRYVLIRLKGSEIRQQYVYFGQTNKTEVVESAEGELYWIRKDEVQSLHLSKIIQLMLEHYFDDEDKKHITVGTITMNEEAIQMIWTPLEDPQVF